MKDSASRISSLLSSTLLIPSLSALCLAFVLTSCNKEEDPSPPPQSEQEPKKDSTVETPPLPVVATFGEGEQITRSDVDEIILSAPAKQRSPGETPFSDWYSSWVRDLFLQRVLEREAADTDIDRSPELIRQARSLRRNLYSEFKLQRALTEEKPITEEELKQRYEETIDEWNKPESRNMYHIFLRFGEGPDSSKDAVLEKLNTLKERVENGENFGMLASENSESESRHQEGWIGFVTKGQLADAADEAIFSTPEGEVSDPVVVGDGAHIFFNENTVAAKNPSYEEVKILIAQRLGFERMKEALAKLAEDAELRGSSFFPDEQELDKLIREGKPDTVILALGTFEMTLQDFRELIRGYQRQVATRTDILGEEAPQYLYDEIKHREIIFQDMLADTETDYSNIEAVFEERKKAVLNEILVRRKMVTWVEKHPELLKEYFKHNIKRFQSTGQVHLHGIRIPLPKNAPDVMARLEQAKLDLESGSTDWETVAKSVNAEYQDWGWFNTRKLFQYDRKAATVAFGMEKGEISAPYTYSGTIRMFAVQASEAPEAPYFDRVRNQVTSVYIENNSQKVYAKVEKEIMEKYNYQVFPENFPTPAEILDSEPVAETP
ncbi:MAG: hypothetical protein CMO55_07040 [Verrucomicrobiales bacterium]|nr:hypothetical protein [Verrucomicrobiales bacterium]